MPKAGQRINEKCSVCSLVLRIPYHFRRKGCFNYWLPVAGLIMFTVGKAEKYIRNVRVKIEQLDVLAYGHKHYRKTLRQKKKVKMQAATHTHTHTYSIYT